MCLRRLERERYPTFSMGIIQRSSHTDRQDREKRSLSPVELRGVLFTLHSSEPNPNTVKKKHNRRKYSSLKSIFRSLLAIQTPTEGSVSSEGTFPSL